MQAAKSTSTKNKWFWQEHLYAALQVAMVWRTKQGRKPGLKKGVLWSWTELLKDTRALRSTTAMKTEILSEILHGPAHKEDAKHVLWLVYTREWKVCCFAKSFCSAATRTIWTFAFLEKGTSLLWRVTSSRNLLHNLRRNGQENLTGSKDKHITVLSSAS